jgi:hypothetical protein
MKLLPFSGKCMELGVMLSKPGSERQRSNVLSQKWKIDPKNKCIHKYKHDHIDVYRENMFVMEGLFEGTKGRRKRKRECSRVNNIEMHCICRKMPQ